MTGFEAYHRPGGLSDVELDGLLDEVDADLASRAEAIADSGRLLLALLNVESGGLGPASAQRSPESQAPAAVTAVIQMRCIASALGQSIARELEVVRDFTGNLIRSLMAESRRVGRDRHAYRSRNRNGNRDFYAESRRDLVRNLLRNLASTRDLVRDLVRTGDVVHEAGIDLVLVYNILQSLGLELDRGLAHCSALIRSLEGDIDGALDLSPSQTYSVSHAIALNLDGYLEGAQRHACSLTLRLLAFPIDASGANLSSLNLDDMGVLDGVVWTKETRWPQGQSSEIRARSREVAEGVWQVVIGDTDRDLHLTTADL